MTMKARCPLPIAISYRLATMPAHRLKLRFAEAARNDLRLIRRESMRRWGRAQRDWYTDRPRSEMDRLTRLPELGRSEANVSAGPRGRLVESHLIFYRQSEQEILIVRVLHQRMDAASLLQDST